MIDIPKDFADSTRLLMGDALYETLVDGLNDEPSVSLRLNPFKTDGRPVGQVTPVPWCDGAYWLESRPNFTFDPLLHAGCYYVQEAASMFLHHVLSRVIDRPVTALDLCAAPGGKSTTARGVLPQGSLLICNEPIRQRAQILSENIQKYGHPDVMVTNNYPRDFRKAGLLFDLIVADVPCSGEGMFRKDAGAIAEWSRQNVENCYRLQREIIEDIWPCLRPGGILVYSTCTFNEQENEDNIAWIRGLGADVLDIDISEEWNITGALKGNDSLYRFIPGRSRSEGLCMAVLRKSDDTVLAERRAKDSGKPAKTRPRTDVGAWINDSDHFTLCERGDTLSAIPTWWLAQYRAAEKSLHLLHAGITLGTVKGKDVVPHQSLALSTALNRSAFALAEVGYGQAIAYLRKEAITLDAATPRGIVLITYHGIPLGFAKNLGNRANNLYPQEWRIKSTHLPEQIPTILNI